MDLDAIVLQLKNERDRIERTIAALEQSSRGSARQYPTSVGGRSGRLSAEGRRRISEMMKKRWAERRKKTARKSSAKS